MGSIGPNRYLPGDIVSPDPKDMCEAHEDRKAVKVLIGESDQNPGNFIPYKPRGLATKGVRNDRNPLTNQPGCYSVSHVPTGNVYVGSSVNLAGRITGNLNSLKDGKHKNKNLQTLFDKEPIVEISFQPTETEEKARSLEQETVNRLLPTGKLCNVAVVDVTKTRVGLKMSQEVIQKIALSNTGRKQTDKARKNMSEAQKAYLATPEGQQRLSAMVNKISRTVTIDGISYSSISEASRALGIPYTTLVRKYKL